MKNKATMLLGLLMIIFLMAFGCAGCAPQDIRWEHLPLKVDAESFAGKVAIKNMNKSFGVELFVDDPDGIKIVSDPLSDTKTGYTEYKFDSNHLIYYTKIYIRSDQYTTGGSENIIAHELFHALGFHFHLSNGLMVPNGVPLGPSVESLVTDEMREMVMSKYPEIFETKSE